MSQLLRPVLFSVLLFGCTTEVADDARLPPTIDEVPGAESGTMPEPTSPVLPIAITTDFCDDATYSGVAWASTASQHFDLSYLPSTAADVERNVIASRLEDAYTNIRSALGITSTPVFTVNLSPSRAAATEHGKSFGRGWPDLNRYDVIYTGAPDSFEVQRYGQLLTLMLNYHLDADNRMRVAFLTTGIAEYLDQSGRDHHEVYAELLHAGIESRVRPAELDAKDVNGRNYGRAGSFVQFLVDRYGMTSFVDIFKATTVNWNGSCYANATYGCISTPEQLTAMLDGVLTTTVGDSWTVVQPRWQAEVEAALERAPIGMGEKPTREIENLLRLMDRAVATDDAAMYRSTLEGFYCDYGGETLRTDISKRAVAAFGATTSKVLMIYFTGIKNFWTAQAFVQRIDAGGGSTFSTVYFEHLPVGWRVTYSADWY